VRAVKYMLDNGAKWDQEDIFGHTAIKHAEEAGDKDILKLINKFKSEHQAEDED